MKDMIGNLLAIDDYVAYPVRHGSSMRQVVSRVVSVHEDEGYITVNTGQRTARVQALHRVVKVMMPSFFEGMKVLDTNTPIDNDDTVYGVAA